MWTYVDGEIELRFWVRRMNTTRVYHRIRKSFKEKNQK